MVKQLIGNRPDETSLDKNDQNFDLRTYIFSLDDIAKKEITVREWGGVKFALWELTGAERAEVLNGSLKRDGTPDLTKLYPLMMIKSMRFPEGHLRAGQLVFSMADRDTVAQKAGSIVERIAMESMAISGMSESARDMLEKNSETTQSEDSISQ